jgi:hypothetical protein
MITHSWNIVDINPIDFREAFSGGRTNAVSLYRDLEHFKEEGHYKDFTSLYPWVNFTCEYPMKAKLEKRHIFGYVKAIVNPPRLTN